ncbi:MAG: peptidylprolyl isomerase [Owenweeksia sp.]|nr:peptidylprolyl isomerase [Owenweeksia sp.]
MLIANDKTESSQAAVAEQKINEIYQKLQNGADFETMVKQYSEDKSSVDRGGRLDPFGINKMFDAL